MKYMGSKRAMLANGLGNLLIDEAERAERVVDMFAGSAAVAWFIGQRSHVPVLAADLQHYSATLATAVIGRTTPFNGAGAADRWIETASSIAETQPREPLLVGDNPANVQKARLASATSPVPLVRAYGGYYYSPTQAARLQALMDAIPRMSAHRSVMRAALVMTAARCAAAPGHTAQPFGMGPRAVRYTAESWRKDPYAIASSFLVELSGRHAQTRGSARVSDAASLARACRPNDLVFLDPPYSNVQYSRFYHVLEAVSRGSIPLVSGVGRYPDIESRPRSAFSMRSKSEAAMKSLLDRLAAAGSSAVLTFPEASCSNGLSGELLKALAHERYKQVSVRAVETRFSTLGGNGQGRPARHLTRELILLMRNAR